MSAAARAETLKLARVLGGDADRLEFLERLDPAAIAELRERTTNVLFDSQREALKRTAAASRLLPTQLVAAIGRRAFGPLLCARLAGELETDRAVSVASHMPTEFLAELAAEMDPRRASAVVSRMPREQVVPCAVEMARRGEFVAMGRFVAHLPDDVLRATVDELDDATILRTGFVLDEPDRLDHLVGMLSEERLTGIGEAAAAEGLWAEALFLAEQLGARNRKRLSAQLRERDLDTEVPDPEIRARVRELMG